MQVSVYDIQDLVEKKLMSSSRKEVAQEYITYRYNRDVARKSRSKDMFLEIIEKKIDDVSKKEKEIDTPYEMMMKFASATTKPFVEDFLLTADVRKAYSDGYIHIHHKDYYPTKSINCFHYPLDKILKKGFKNSYGSLRAAKRIETASSVSQISIRNIQNELYGEQSIPAFDYYLAPYVKFTFIEEVKKIEVLFDKDLSDLYNYQVTEYTIKQTKELEEKDALIQKAINNTVNRVHQSMEAFIHNINMTQSKYGNQGISSINYGTDTSPEGRCIIREILKATEEGIGNNETAVFPVQIWKKKKGINYNKEDPNYDLYKLACKVTAKRFFPNFLNLDAKYNKNDKNGYKDEIAMMATRHRIYENINGEKTAIERGNLSFSTLNLVKMAIESVYEAQEKTGVRFTLGKGSYIYMNSIYRKQVKRIYIKKVEEYSDILAKQLYNRYKFQCTAAAKQFPLLMSGLWKDSESLQTNDIVENVLKHGTVSIGFTGLAEALTVLLGKSHAESEESQKFGLEIVETIHDLCEVYKKRYGINYTVFATPIDELQDKFIRKDKKKYGTIIGITDKDYYTDSSHVPIWYKCTVEEKAKIEAPYYKYINGGQSFLVEVDSNSVYDIETIEKIVQVIDENDIGYLLINHEKSKCTKCGFESNDIKLHKCPNCGSTQIDILRRTSDYKIETKAEMSSIELAQLRDKVTNKL